MPDPIIKWTREKLERFKLAFQQAEQDAERGLTHVFTFEDNEFLVGYAKHLIEYLDAHLPKSNG
jgi:hypothetical protein